MKTIFSRLLIAGVAVIAFAGVAQAQSYSKAVQQFCRADYKKFCADYGLETSGLRSCMDRNGNNLSKSCVRALVRDGYVTQAEVDRRK
jgi:hypothetical protein